MKPSVKVGNLLSEFEKHPEAKDLIEKVEQLSKRIDSKNSFAKQNPVKTMKIMHCVTQVTINLQSGALETVMQMMQK